MRKPLLATLLLTSVLAACSPTAGVSHKDSPEYEAAEALKKSGNKEAAANAWRRMAQADPDDIESAIELSAAERKLGNAEQAAQLMAEYSTRFPNNIPLMTQMGYALIDAGKTQDAVKIFEQAHTQDPLNPLILSGKGVAFDKAGNHLAAQDIYEEALTLSPDSVTLHNNLGMSLILNNEPQAAIDILEKLYAQNATNQTVRQNLALAYGIKGNSKKALELNLKDLSSEEAQENLRFYQKYIGQHKNKNGKPKGQAGIGFSNATPDMKAKTIIDDENQKEKKSTAVKVIPLKIEEHTPEKIATPPAATPKNPPEMPLIKPSEKTDTDTSMEAPPTGTPLPTRNTQEKSEYPKQPK